MTKKANRFEIPEGSDPAAGYEKNIPIATLDNPGEVSSTLYDKPTLKGLFKVLEQKGFKFTSYEEK